MYDTELKEAKDWYYSAVKSAIVLYGFSEYEATKAVEDSPLRELLDEFPDETMHDDVRTTANYILKHRREQAIENLA